MKSADDDDADERLARWAANGDRAAFGQLIVRYKEPLYRLLRRLTGQPEDALDLVQETFIALWQSLPRYDPDRPFESWVRRIAINKAHDWSRRRTVRRFLFAVPRSNDGYDAAPDPRPSPETMASDVQQMQLLDRAIAALPTVLKEPLVLTAIDGLSQREAATVLGISEKAVETRIRRARLRLAEVVDREP